MAIQHARNRGATKEWISDLDRLDPQTVWAVVTIIYGDPPRAAWKTNDQPNN